MTFAEIVKNGCNEWNLPITDEAVTRMERFSDLLIEKNRVMNLTAVTEPEEIALRHMLDCLFLLTVTEFEGKKILDIGCGPGFPSMPLKCYDPNFDITPLDSTGKRIKFIEDSCAEQNIPITAVTGRAEEYIQKKGVRESFDIVVSRAVAPLNILSELCLPYLKVGGRFLAMKSVDSGEEINRAARCISILGGRLLPSVDYVIPGANVRHRVVLVEKCAPTPKGYPRRWAKIQKAPL